jgi:cation-transporting ATPase E
VFNLILAVFGGITLAFGDWRDALFLGVLVGNTTIGIAQELRAKRALDRLAALVAPTATVIRDGKRRRLHVEEIVTGDLLLAEPGDQIVADGPLEAADGLRLDESILTGESQAVARGAGDRVRSGSFIVEGIAAYRAEAVGAESYAERVTGVARSFRHPRSPLERSLNRLLGILVAVMVPLGVALGISLWLRSKPAGDAVQTIVAAVVNLVPEGLILLTSLTFAAGAVRMARRGALAQQLNAIESLASVDVICLDKTGTLTEHGSRVVGTVPAAGVAESELAAALGRYAASSPVRNSTVLAIAEAFPAAAETPSAQLAFSAARRLSALELGGVAYVLGAPESFPLGPLAERAQAEAASGRRVLAIGTVPRIEDAAAAAAFRPLGLVLLAERLRPGAADTVSFLRREGVELRVLSGDAPATAAAIARDAGLEGAATPLDGHRLPEDPRQLAAVIAEVTVVGRISPDGKRRVVEALRDAGRYVAMVGDGVNDVPALKAARLAIAQGTGTEMARCVADLVLVRGDFATVPPMVAEGRRMLRNLQRVAKLFVAKSALAAFLILTIGLTPLDYPFLPRHLTIVSSLAIGFPGFFLALAPSSGPWRPDGFVRDTARFAVPAGVAAGLGVLGAYLVALKVLALPLLDARTISTTVLVAVGLYLILALEASGLRRGAAVTTMCVLLALVYLVVLAVPPSRGFFELAVPGPTIWLLSAAGTFLSLALLWAAGIRPQRTARSAAPSG